MANAPMLCLLMQLCTATRLRLRCDCCVGSVRTAVAHATCQSCASWPSIRGRVSENHLFLLADSSHVLMIEHGFSLSWILCWQLRWQQKLRYKVTLRRTWEHGRGTLRVLYRLLQSFYNKLTTYTQPAQWNYTDSLKKYCKTSVSR